MLDFINFEHAARLTDEQFATFWRSMTERQKCALSTSWQFWSRPSQRAPDADWRVWVLLAGRGFGKTRAGAEWIRGLAENNAGIRLALVAATYHEGRAVMVDGESGLRAIAPRGNTPRWNGSLRRLKWRNGAQAFLYSAEEPDALRGPQHHAAWCDELAKWPHAEDTWMNLQMGLRLGNSPRAIVTTTPRPVPLLKKLLAEKFSIVTRGTTRENDKFLPPDFVETMYETWGNSRLGRQELDGEIIEDTAGALWTRAMLEVCHVRKVPVLARVVVAVDPAVSSGENADACGIIVAGKGVDSHYYVLADKTVRGASPQTWARIVSSAAHVYGADRVVAEANNGGDLVREVLHSVDEALPVKLVRASRGKVARAEPIAALYERALVHHAARFAELDDELCGLIAGGAYHGPGKSPDRADALVWALTELSRVRDAKPALRIL
jgi:phage terminase large subunit-like protein